MWFARSSLKEKEMAFSHEFAGYSDEDWASINALGSFIDKVFLNEGITLTMGGEPTFISKTKRDAPEWKTSPLGKDKFHKALSLMAKLKHHFAPTGIVVYEQGQWYPHEHAPRWKLGCYWRKDGEPLWVNKKLLMPPEKKQRTPITLETAHQFLITLCQALGISDDFVLPAYEDPYAALWTHHYFPLEEDSRSLNVQDISSRRLITERLESKLQHPVGFLVPLRYSTNQQLWQSALWKFRSKRVILLASDASMGYRFPLNRLPKEPESALEVWPIEMQGNLTENLPSHQELWARIENRPRPAKNNKASYLPHTAIGIHIVDNILHLFLPPTKAIEHYLELVAAVEWTSLALSLPIKIEGYPPPMDLRMDTFALTPDPGVLEINMQPSPNWDTLNHTVSVIYEEAKQCGLKADKYLFDGRPTGTGGGYHITLGGISVDKSPFLTRPDLLRSLLTYWQHHPALSYFFSSLFVGPDSQSPRIDEARMDNLYEIELAFERLPKDKIKGLWEIDRALSHFLMDLTGNTHRAEFCIDKLYNAALENRRLGIVELRSFETQPHPQMALVLHLLIRVLCAFLAKHPYHHPLIRWGTALHDKYMLPEILWEDIAFIVRDLNIHGFPFQLDWLTPHQDFRFPILGSLLGDGITLDIRQALEPWPVLQEEKAFAGASRSVDTSLERIEVKLYGDYAKDVQLLCNGIVVPLMPTHSGDWVAGIRFKAFQSLMSQHPTLPAQSMLSFDIIERKTKKFLNGCEYSVVPPRGTTYAASPATPEEAAERRAARFNVCNKKSAHEESQIGHNTEFPYTLDLRKKDHKS